MTDTEARRKFEEAYQAAIDRGVVSTKRLCWQIWQAALDSVVVELPELSEYIDRYGQGESCDEYVTDVIGAIHAAGVKTR